MSVTGAVAASLGLGPELIATPEWHSVSTWQHNAMFEGPEHVTEGILLLLEPYLRTPVFWRPAAHGTRTALELPTHGCGALVLRNVSALDRREQAALLQWLDAGRKQVVSTTARPVFPLIALRLFDETLYSRLNVMLMRVDSTGAPI